MSSPSANSYRPVRAPGTGARANAPPGIRQLPHGNATIPVPQSVIARYRPLYREAARRFGVNSLLISSIHRQETSFSAARGSYHGLNFAHCCAGPMQFNVRNGPPSTWTRFREGFRYGTRPAAYPHGTASHPSVYDDFDAIMAAAWLLRANGAGEALDTRAWTAAYEYYGPSLDDVDYADQVLARAIAWSRHGICAACAPDPQLVAGVEDSYGAPVRAQLIAAERAKRARDYARRLRERAQRNRRRRAARKRAVTRKRHATQECAAAERRRAAANRHAHERTIHQDAQQPPATSSPHGTKHHPSPSVNPSAGEPVGTGEAAAGAPGTATPASP